MMEGYEKSFEPDFHDESDIARPQSIHLVSKQAAAASWKTLAEERIRDTRPTIPLGKRFWPTSKDETRKIKKLFEDSDSVVVAHNAPFDTNFLIGDTPSDVTSPTFLGDYDSAVATIWAVRGCRPRGSWK
jgi:hypothetical protein